MRTIIGNQIEHLSRTDSTNNHASRQLMTKRLPEGIVYSTSAQEKGRGQVNQHWESEPGKNITVSVVLYPEFVPILSQFLISKAVALAVYDFVSVYVPDVHIKWPNDIYVGKKKIAGTLIENSLREGIISSSIVGIGLNINQRLFVSDAPNPVSLALLTNKGFNLDDCLEELCDRLDDWYMQLKAGEVQKIDETYERRLFRMNEWASYGAGEESFEGRITGVDEIGRLVIEKRDGTKQQFHLKEVEFII
ncbi:biotin--[acetyl-CoA-carboxylase] ligase [Prolixibacter sp. SD074]|uniref:biotin--[acetyl-CoA-carboxylase] ligase n=1 Tax=Prolixibacter sp. SD074 TaxID=2652391 RepID=UPI0012864ADA|nr:biotin--[acetyl-CoA-carboxylase] ligase [Prolixibacter sp. SD074]GET30989.1 biotin--[acetyl-CoA-carboxylase] ligase [Prolixibacter sp. SD074]